MVGLPFDRTVSGQTCFLNIDMYLYWYIDNNVLLCLHGGERIRNCRHWSHIKSKIKKDLGMACIDRQTAQIPR